MGGRVYAHSFITITRGGLVFIWLCRARNHKRSMEYKGALRWVVLVVLLGAPMEGADYDGRNEAYEEAREEYRERRAEALANATPVGDGYAPGPGGFLGVGGALYNPFAVEAARAARHRRRARLHGQQQQPVQELRLATLNVWDLYVAKDRKTRMDAIGRFFAKNPRNVDVLALQELWVQDDYRALRAQMALEFPHAHYFTSGAVGSGLAVFSRFPIRDAWWRGFTVTGKPGRVFDGDWYAGKGVGGVRVQHPVLGAIDVFDTHLIANYAPDDPSRDRYRAHRATQLYEVLRQVDRTSAPHAHTFLLGDLNTAPAQDAYQSLLRAHNLYTPQRRALRNVWRDVHRRRRARGRPPAVPVAPGAGTEVSRHPEQWDQRTAKVASTAHLHYTFNLPSSTYYAAGQSSQQIDHIFYVPDGRVRCRHAEVFLTTPTVDAAGKPGPSYSDHAAVLAVFRVAPGPPVPPGPGRRARARSGRRPLRMAQATQRVMVSLNEELASIQSQQGTDQIVAVVLALLVLLCLVGAALLVRRACAPEAVAARAQGRKSYGDLDGDARDPDGAASLLDRVPAWLSAVLLGVLAVFLALATQFFVFNASVFLPQEYAAFREFQYEWALWLRHHT